MDVARVLGATKSLARTGLLSVRKSSDTRRWKNDREINPLWFGRSIIAAENIQPGSSVIEFGAGTGRLGEVLPPGCTYQPTDLVKRTPEFLAIDLNTDMPLPDGFDVAVLLGVVEYLYDPDRVVHRLGGVAGCLIMSYCISEPGANRLSRRSLGWVNDLSYQDLISTVNRSGFSVERTQEIGNTNKQRQVLMTCRSTGL